MNISSIYVLNILIIALPFSIFEIFIEKNNGWGSGWSKDKWYAKPFLPNNSIVKLLIKILKIESPLNYHFFVFTIFLPIIFLLEYFYLANNILLMIASFIGVVLFEDFFWFLFNWNFDSLKQLLKGPNGSIWWHKRWIKVSNNYYLPASYFPTLILSVFLLLLSTL
ncbi:MAG: hypothetical protein Q7K54_00875 [Candidatus Parcubacteria bacterium]|nr:hypothetical protein [Candidatus Parcubacteria bacterium]